MFYVVSLTTNAGSMTAILQVLQVNPPEAFKPLPQPGCLGAAAHVSQVEAIGKRCLGIFSPFAQFRLQECSRVEQTESSAAARFVL